MNLAPDIRRGQARDLRDRFRVYAFQIRHHHLTVERIKSLDHGEQAGERLLAVRGGFHIFCACVQSGFLQGEERLHIPPAPSPVDDV